MSSKRELHDEDTIFELSPDEIKKVKGQRSRIKLQRELVKKCVDSDIKGWIRGVGVDDVKYLGQLCTAGNDENIDAQCSEKGIDPMPLSKSEKIIQCINPTVNTLDPSRICTTIKHPKVAAHCKNVFYLNVKHPKEIKTWKYHTPITIILVYVAPGYIEAIPPTETLYYQFLNLAKGEIADTDNTFGGAYAFTPSQRLNYICRLNNDLFLDIETYDRQQVFDTIGNRVERYAELSFQKRTSLDIFRYIYHSLTYGNINSQVGIITIDASKSNTLQQAIQMSDGNRYDLSDVKSLTKLWRTYRDANLSMPRPLTNTMRLFRESYKISGVIQRVVGTNIYVVTFKHKGVWYRWRKGMSALDVSPDIRDIFIFAPIRIVPVLFFYKKS